MTTETDIQRRIQVALSWGDARMFRNNVGNGWQGTVVNKVGDTVTLRNARRIQFGLAPGSSDLIGIQKFVITPAMLGLDIGVFTAIEVKNETRATPEQHRFIETIQELGGIAGIAHSVDEARKIVTPFSK